MKVSQVMTNAPVTVGAGTAVRTARRLLAAHGISTLPVVDARGRILGIVGESDVMDPTLHKELVSRVMRHTTVLAHPETDVTEAGRTLRTLHVKSLPVVDAADRVVGMVSRSDIVRVLARDDDLLQQSVLDALSAAGLRGWRVDVHHGDVELSAPADGAGDPALAGRTAAATWGVDTVRVH